MQEDKIKRPLTHTYEVSAVLWKQIIQERHLALIAYTHLDDTSFEDLSPNGGGIIFVKYRSFLMKSN